jgi:hypothetical protein
MLRLIVAAAALALLCAPCSAEIIPARYLGPYHGHLTVIVTPLGKRMDAACDGPAWACADVISPRRCVLYLPPRKSVPRKFYRALWRHEIAHCNGWPDDHPRI